MEWMEVDPMPAVCISCQEEDCYNCDYMEERWQLSRVDDLKIRRKSLVRFIERTQHKIEEIDRELALLEV